jgi:hypothetical protein
MKDKIGLFVVYEGESVKDAINEHYNGYTEEKYLVADVLKDLKEGESFSVHSQSDSINNPVFLGNYQIINGKITKKS